MGRRNKIKITQYIRIAKKKIELLFISQEIVFQWSKKHDFIVVLSAN